MGKKADGKPISEWYGSWAESEAGREFLCGAISSNTNSFGLHSHIMVDKKGKVWEVAKNRDIQSRNWQVNDVIKVPLSKNGAPEWGKLNCEIPAQLPDMSANLLRKVWKKANG